MSQHINHRQAGGFTLVELMIAMVLGLIVIGAVLALSLSMIRANTDTISATRLTQELRATAAAIISELQRAGSTDNPYNITAAEALGVTDGDPPTCIRYTYNEGGTTVSRAISLSGVAIYLGTTTCGAGGTKLSSDRVTITTLQFDRDPLKPRQIIVSVSGKLELSEGNEVSRTYSQIVFAPGLSS